MARRGATGLRNQLKSLEIKTENYLWFLRCLVVLVECLESCDVLVMVLEVIVTENQYLEYHW